MTKNTCKLFQKILYESILAWDFRDEMCYKFTLRVFRQFAVKFLFFGKALRNLTSYLRIYKKGGIVDFNAMF